MNLHSYFTTQCRATSVLLKTHSPTVKSMVHGRKQERIGTVATLSFDGFKVDVTFIESGRTAYAQQTIWLSFILDNDETMPFSVYDILAICEPENFKCYTYTYVDSVELMRECFGEINDLLGRLVPLLSEVLANGIEKNKLIQGQRDCINKYFGDSVMEQTQMLGDKADNLLNAMMRNFYEAQIEAAVIGAQALFYNGKEGKAFKKLARSKCRSLYQENLFCYLRDGGKSEKPTEALKKASPKRGARRHGETLLDAVKLFFLGLLIDIPVSATLILIFYVASKILFRDAVLYMGFYENVFMIPFFGSLVSMCLATHVTRHIRKRKTKNGDKTVQDVKTPKAVNTLLKYVTIIGETFALIGCITSIYSTAVFYEDRVAYPVSDFPFSHAECSYESIDSVAIVEGYYQGNEFIRSPYVAIVTRSGAVLDLYNATMMSAEDFSTHTAFLEEKDIEIIQVKTIDELK